MEATHDQIQEYTPSSKKESPPQQEVRRREKFILGEREAIRREDDRVEFSCSGFTVKMGHLEKPYSLFLDDRDSPLIMTPQDVVGRMDFTPNGNKAKVGSEVTAALANAVQGFEAFFRVLDEQNQSDSWHIRPEYLFGDTNRRMAEFAVNNLGFHMVRSSEHQQAKTVVARTEEVRANFEKFLKENEDLVKKIKERALRHNPPQEDSQIAA